MTRPLCAALLLVHAIALSDTPVEYRISFENAVHHEARVSVTYANIGEETLELRLSRSSPGRYALHEFGKNIYDVEAVDGQGNALVPGRPNPYQWNVDGHDGTVTVNYTIYADRAGGTYSGIDAGHAHLNMPATFMWARGFEARPIVIRFAPSEERWKIASQLAPTDDPMTFTAPDLQYFLDSPTELSDFSIRSWQIESGDEHYTIRLAVHHDGSEEDVDTYAEMTRKVVDASVAVFGEVPAFDLGAYTFIADYLPHVVGDGMEHRNSTVLTNSRSLEEAEFEQIGTLTHEFFHAWNVERLRPADLQPFDFEKANMSASLWFAEGFTSHYERLIRRRAGLLSDAEFAEDLAEAINTVVAAPGQRFFSAEQMSMRAAFSDAATSIDPTNFSNTFISYYTWGDVIGVALDLTLRVHFDGLSLDDYMRLLWQRYGRPEIPYTIGDLRATLAVLTDDVSFADDFFDRYIQGHELADYETLLGKAGFVLRSKDGDRAWLGNAKIRIEDKVATIDSNTIIGSPLYDAGLDRGDEIQRIDRRRIRSARNWERALGRYEPGEAATIHFVQRGVERSARIVFAADPELEIVTYEKAGLQPSELKLAFRSDWLDLAPIKQ